MAIDPVYYGIYKVRGLLKTLYTWIIYSPWTTLEPFIMNEPCILWTIYSLWTTVDISSILWVLCTISIFPRGNFPNVPFPKWQLLKGSVRPSEVSQGAKGPSAAARMG